MRLALLASLLFGLSVTARAQIIEVYGTFSPVHVSSVDTGITVQPNGDIVHQTSFWAAGVGGGVTFGVLPLGPVRVGLDLRGSTKPGTVGADTALVGLKVGLRLPLLKLKPYAEAAGGYLATRTANVTAGVQPAPISATISNQYGVYEILGGVDYPLIHFFDLRLVEIGGGKAINAGGSSPTLFTINSGIVFHF